MRVISHPFFFLMSSLRSYASQDLLHSVQVQGTFTRKFSIATPTYFVPQQVNMSLPILLLLRSLHHPSMPSPCAVNEECLHLLHYYQPVSAYMFPSPTVLIKKASYFNHLNHPLRSFQLFLSHLSTFCYSYFTSERYQIILISI